MLLTDRISRHDTASDQIEDVFESSRATLFGDLVTAHGDPTQTLAYKSPHLPRPLVLELAEPDAEQERLLFGHHLWNASLLLAELIERDTVGAGENGLFSVTGRRVLELGAGCALPSLMSALLGAERVVVTDYPAKRLIATMRGNLQRNAVAEASPLGTVADLQVHGHVWGEFDAQKQRQDDSCSTSTEPSEEMVDNGWFALENQHKFDCVLAADCLWMTEQHEQLRRSISWFLKETDDEAHDAQRPRAWVVAGKHTRDGLRGFFDEDALARHGLEVESLSERDCYGNDRAWVADREEDPILRKRWLAVAVLRRSKYRTKVETSV